MKSGKHTIKSKSFFIATLIAAMFLYAACPQYVSLGESVDILPPAGQILYPDSGETPIKGSFLLKGVASDDEGIRAISVVFENLETKEKTRSYPVQFENNGSSSTSVIWSVMIDNESTGAEPNHELVQQRPIVDGEYRAVVTITDTNGKTQSINRTYKIDNTAPVFIVSRPSTVIDESAAPTSSDPADGYGAIFSVVGQAGERNTVEKLNVLVTKDVAGTLLSNPIDISNMFVGNSINAQVSAYSSTDALYGLQNQDKTKPIRGQLYLYDNAREYKGGNASGEGNKADWYYLWDAIYTDVIAKGFTPEVISDYFAGKKGSNKNDHDKKLQELRTNSAALDKLKSSKIKMGERRSTFKLEPSKSPGFKVIGVNNLPNTSSTPLNVAGASSRLFKPGNETAFSVELIRNKDNTPLVGGSNLGAYHASNIEIVLLKWNGTGTANESFKTGTNLEEKSLLKFSALTAAEMSRITVGNGNLRVKCTFDTSWGEGFYAVKVKGTDEEGNKPVEDPAHRFEAYDDSNTASGGFYIINFLAAGSGPRIRPVRPQGFKNTTVDIEADVSGIDASGAVYYSIDTPVNAGSPDATKKLTKVNLSDPNDLRYKKAGVDISALPDGTHKIYFLVKASSGSTDTDETDFTVDKTAPAVDISSPDLSKNQSGDFTLRGTVTDAPSGVKNIKYIVGKQKPSDPNDITTKPSETSSSWKPLVLSGDTWAIGFTGADNITQKEKAKTLGKKVSGLAAGVELYDIPIFFLVEDKAGEAPQKGNVDIIRKIVRVDPNGDIPEVTILSPEANKILGGTINISGTVSVPNPAAGQVGSVWIQITDKKDGSGKPDFTQSAIFGTVDWCPNPDGKQLTSYTTGNPYWSVEINGNKEFEPSSGTQRIIWFRLRAKNDKTPPVAGQWTEPVKVTVDNAAPTITGMKVATQSNINTPIPPITPDNKTYVSNMWIKGDDLYLCADLAHNAGIEMISISGTYVPSSVSLVGDTQITGYKIDNQQCFVRDGNNYKMRLPLKTMANPGSNNGFTINLTIKAKKQGVIEGLTASTSFSFKYDNTAPTAVFGTKIYSSGTVQVNGTSFTDPALRGKTNINTSMKVFVSGEDIAINAFDRSNGTVTLASAPARLTKGYLIYSPIEYLRPDASGKVGVFGAAYDVGAGVEKVKVKYNNVASSEITLEFPSGVQTDVGSGDVNFVTWKGELDVSSFADGIGKIVITPIDRANNEHAPIEVPVKLKKSPLTISSVKLGTDINRNGAIDNTSVETKTLALTYDADKPNGLDSEKYDWHGKADGGAFRFKNATSHIKVDISGGNGIKKYTLKCVTNNQNVKDLTNLPSDGVITLNAADFDKIEQSTGLSTSDPQKRKLLLTVWDSASGLTAGTDTWKAALILDVVVDTKDRTVPKNEIDPFKWISETENSLYNNSKDNGHIEIGTGLPSAFTDGGSGLMDKDDKVSGKISITGTAHDDQVITEIWAKIDGFKFDGIAGAAVGAETKLATFTSGSFPAVGNFDAKGWHFSVVSSDFSVENGHTVKWKLDWNSAKITETVGLDKNITVKVKDTDQTNTAEKSRKVDVVPYITGVTRKSRYNTNRARSGAIPLLRGEEGNAIKGFNFAAGSSTSLKITEKKDGTGHSVEMQNLALSGDKQNFTFKVPDTAKDGYLRLVVNNVPALNNMNSYIASNMEKSDTYGTAKHSDDRLVHIWRVNKEDTFKGSKNAIYPAMSKGTGGTLYASFSNYSKSEVYYSSAFTGGGAVAVGGSGTETLFTGYDPPEETDITVNGTEVNVLYAANYHGGTPYKWGIGVPGSPWNDTNPENAGGIYLYDKDAFDTEVGNYNSAKIYRFELFTYDNELQQFRNIRTVRSGDNIYTVYYDRLTGAVKFAWVDDSRTPDTRLKALPWCVIDGKPDVTDTNSKVPDASSSAQNDQKTFTFVSPNNTAYAAPYVLDTFEDGLSVSHTVWESIAVATTTQGNPIVVYMDAATGSLRLARSTSNQPTSPSDWKIQNVLASSDPNSKLASNYINACIGTDGYLHIAFQNTRGQLVYVKSTNTSNDGSTQYTFGASEILDDSGTFIDMTMEDKTPYITYVSRPNSYDAIRIAYRTSMDFGNTGTDVPGWETMTAPLDQRAASGRICIETQAKHYNATEKMPVAVGFTTGSDYRAAFYVGK